MNRILRASLPLFAAVLLASASLYGQRLVVSAPHAAIAHSFVSPFIGGYGYSAYSYPFAGYGYPWFTAPQSYLPNYWWVSPYPIADPRQEGYNPYAGYEWDSVGTLILSTFPQKARVTLDGVAIGTADKLGPTQLPSGDHTLRIEAPGFQPYEGVVKIDKPGFQLLDIQLKRPGVAAMPAPPA